MSECSSNESFDLIQKKPDRFHLGIDRSSRSNSKDSLVDHNKPNRYPAPPIPRIRHERRKKFSSYRLSALTADKATRRVLAPYMRTVRRNQKKTSIKKNEEFSFYLQKKPSSLLRNLSAFLSDTVDLPSLLHETADVLKSITNSDGVALYMVDSALGEIYQHPKNVISGRHKVIFKIGTEATIAAYVAFHREFVIVDDALADRRFPLGLGWNDTTVKSVLCVPVVSPDDDAIAVIELYKDVGRPPFEKSDLQIVVAVTGWMGAAIHQNQQRLALQKQQELNEYLLQLTRCYFAEIVIMDKILTEIVNFAKITLGAERGSFFIIDHDCDELVADHFDEGIDNETGDMLYKKKQKIRLAKERGIAGLVAKSGLMVNIKDAYNDPRFNREADIQSGYITRSILCMPIVGRDGVLGMVQLINKKIGTCFSSTDENLIKTFSVYCALALNYAKLQEKMSQVAMSNRVNTEMLTYHMKACSHDRSRMLLNPKIEEVPKGFGKFAWYLTGFEEQLSQLVFYMLNDVAGESFVDFKTVCTFILMVKKCYRKNPYHNFEHAFNVCHCMYNILKRNLEVFTPTEVKALIIASLCHDLDHQGYTNNFLQLTNHDLMDLYPESCLENHHFQVTMLIINTTKIFNQLSSHTFKELTAEIHDAIIATDLALYFRCRSKLIVILDNNEFDWMNGNHRVLVKSIMMTSCDLSGQCKPFPVAKKITESLYREFYHQGDIEKELDLTPLSMMDREKQHLIPDDQFQFIGVVCLPCTELLYTLLPNTEDLYTQCRELRDHWKEIIEMRGKKVWKPEDSFVIGAGTPPTNRSESPA